MTADPTLAAILSELRLIRQAIEAQQRQPASTLHGTDRATMARLLPVLAATFGPEMWRASEVLTHKSVDLQIVTEDLSAKALGRLCKRAANIPIAGFYISAEAAEHGATLWAVKRAL